MTLDAIVVGAGPAGSVAALGLARAGLAVALVEKSPFPRPKVCGEYISAGTWPLLRRLGVGEALAEAAGPPVRRVGLFAGDTVLEAPMPAPAEGEPWGRAVGRHRLDDLLLDAARDAGAQVWQPWRLAMLAGAPGIREATLVHRDGRAVRLRARLVIDAHGSWERAADLGAGDASDFLAFKARFEGARLATGLMPLVLFPGGYGGMVHTDGGRVSLSCCVRREALRRCRRARPGLAAGDALAAHIARSNRGVREALGAARAEGAWLASGPIRPGIRVAARAAAVCVGNAAGEAHPLVAEGISMAIQSGWMLAEIVGAAPALDEAAVEAIAGRYAARWRRTFAARVHASAAFAAIATSPAAPAAVALLRGMPSILTWGARRSGKAAPVPASWRS